jgi:UMF1 family MFS transporter
VSAALVHRRRSQWAWGLYGWANHAYATAVLVGLFPIFLSSYWAKDLPGPTITLYFGLTNSCASFIVMLISPWLGALADRRGRKKFWLGCFTAIGVVATFALSLTGPGGWLWALAALLISSVGFFAGSSFQDALLLQVAESQESDRISAFGFALGYLGGGVMLLLAVLMVLHPQWFGIADAAIATRLVFALAALWWALFALPLFRYVPEAPPVPEATGWRELRETLKRVLRNRTVFSFLLAYWLYIDAIGTLQQMAVDFGVKLGFAQSTLIQALLMVQFLSFPAAWCFGRLAGHIGTKRSIDLGLCVFVFVTFWAYTMRTEAQFYEMAALVALVQGGVQALSRSYFSRLIPRERAGEYFGFYNMLGKFGAVLGPAVVGIVAATTGSPRLSILVLAIFFVGGILLLTRVRESAAGAGSV